MSEETKTILRQANEAIQKAIELARQKRNEEDRKYIVSAIGQDLVAILTPLLEKIADNSRLNKQDIEEIIRQIKVEPPQVNVGSPQVDVKVPDINVPAIIFPKEEIIGAIKKAFSGIVVKSPNVEVKPTPINIPKEMEVKGIAGYFKTLIKALSGKLNVGLEKIDRDNPLTVTLVDKKGNYYTAIGGGGVIMAGGRGGGDIASASIIGNGTKTVTTAGTRVQLSATSVPCRRIFIQAHESNTGTLVVGGSDVVAALVGRKGLALFATQGEFFNVNNLNLLYVDSTADGDSIHFYYEV